QRMLPDEEHGRGHRDAGVGEQRHPRRRYVDVHDAYGLTLLIIGRGVEQREPQAKSEEQHGEAGAPRKNGAAQALEPGGVGVAMHVRLTDLTPSPWLFHGFSQLGPASQMLD